MKRLVSILLVLALCNNVFAQNSIDSLVFQKVLSFATKEKLEKKPAGERVAAIGRFFLNTPYVAYTLEAPGPERLQVNLHELDCTTLVENALVFSKLLISKKKDFETYKELLAQVRYRFGKLDGYPSRLHYASDWLTDNAQKGYVQLLKGPGMVLLQPHVNYMTTHPTAYSALKADSLLLPVITAQEAKINARTFLYLPKNSLTEKAPFIHTGDIIAITTSFPGLDFAHLGIAIRQKNKLYMLHASSTGKKVMMTEVPLTIYLAGIKKHTGIVVARPL